MYHFLFGSIWCIIRCAASVVHPSRVEYVDNKLFAVPWAMATPQPEGHYANIIFRAANYLTQHCLSASQKT